MQTARTCSVDHIVPISDILLISIVCVSQRAVPRERFVSGLLSYHPSLWTVGDAPGSSSITQTAFVQLMSSKGMISHSKTSHCQGILSHFQGRRARAVLSELAGFEELLSRSRAVALTWASGTDCDVILENGLMLRISLHSSVPAVYAIAFDKTLLVSKKNELVSSVASATGSHTF